MTLLGATKPALVPRKFSNCPKNSNAAALSHIKKLVELQNDQAKTYAEESRSEIETNQDTIRKLRSDISEARILLRSTKTNECLMRQALCDHHTGSSIFREREPRDINESVDYKLSDLQSKLNRMRHANRVKKKYIQNLLSAFDETVNDAAYLELEGPMGDTRCLAIENEICAKDKKYMEAEMIGHTYRHIRDRLAVEGLSNHSALDAVRRVLRSHEEELAMGVRSQAQAVKGRETADAEVYKMEYDLFSLRKHRKNEYAGFKKRTDEEKHEFTALWKTIQAHFAAQESMPLSHMTYHSRLSISSSAELHDVSGLFEYSEDEIELMQEITGSHNIPEMADKFEKQQSTCQYAKSMANELEVRKAALLLTLDDLNTVRDSLLHRTETADDALLRSATGDSSKAAVAAHQSSWSRLAACSRVTQTLARLRQLLEYLTTAFVSAGLLQSPSVEHDASDTAAHLRALLASAGAGAAALMASLQGAEPERARRAAAAAALLMTRSEQRMRKPRAQLESDAVRDDIGYVGTDSDTTGDDTVPSRAAIKRQAHLILLAKQKTGSRGRRK